jgi:hypothetical protein
VEDEQQTVAPPAAVADVWLYPSSTGSSGEWEPSNNDSGGVNILSDDGIFSELESHPANNSGSVFEEVQANPLGHIGLYGTEPAEDTESWQDKYHERNWHCESWQLLPQHKICRTKTRPEIESCWNSEETGRVFPTLLE